MSRTKIIGILLLASAVVSVAVDLLDGGPVDFQKHYDSIVTALGGAGLITLRAAIDKK